MNDEKEAGASLERDKRIADLLDAHRPTAKTHRELAYDALKAGQRPEYILARYHGYPGLEGLTLGSLKRAAEKLEAERK